MWHRSQDQEETDNLALAWRVERCCLCTGLPPSYLCPLPGLSSLFSFGKSLPHSMPACGLGGLPHQNHCELEGWAQGWAWDPSLPMGSEPTHGTPAGTPAATPAQVSLVHLG